MPAMIFFAVAVMAFDNERRCSLILFTIPRLFYDVMLYYLLIIA